MYGMSTPQNFSYVSKDKLKETTFSLIRKNSMSDQLYLLSIEASNYKRDITMELQRDITMEIQ